MFSKRSFTTSVLIAAIGLGAGTAVMSPSDANAGDPCKGKTFALTDIEAACKKGGEREAIAEMKRYRKTLEGKGKKDEGKCSACHEKGKVYHEINGDVYKKREDALRFLKEQAGAK